MSYADTIHLASDYVKGRLNGRESGLGKLADQIEDPLVIPYKDIPGFPVSTAIGHKGNFIVGTLSCKTVIAMQGRIHYYEGYGMNLVVLPIRVMEVLGTAPTWLSMWETS